jgi:hypothetical protein
MVEDGFGTGVDDTGLGDDDDGLGDEEGCSHTSVHNLIPNP